MGMRGYQQYDMIIAGESQYSWGGTDYTHLALKLGTTIPTGMSTSNSTGITRNNQPSITGATFDRSFIIPTVFDVLSIIDGTMSGTIKLGAYDDPTGGASCEITKAELTLLAIDASGTERTIATKQEIWAGSIYSWNDGWVTKQMMYWIDVVDAIVYAKERIVLKYTITYSTVDGFASDEQKAHIYCTPDTDETTITLPFVM